MVTRNAATKRKYAAAVAALAALTVLRPGLAWAYGPYEEFGRKDSIKALVYLHLSLGPSVVRDERKATFGFLLRSEFAPAHPAYQMGKGPYVDSSGIGIGIVDLHFGMNGKSSGIDVVGWSMLGDAGDRN